MISEKDLPSLVAVLAVIGGTNLIVPLLPSPDGLMSTEVATGRAIAAAGVISMAAFLGTHFRSVLTRRLLVGLAVMVLLGVATLWTARWDKISSGAVLAVVPTFLAPFLVAFLAGRKEL